MMALLWVAAEVLAANHSIAQAASGVFGAIYVGMPLRCSSRSTRFRLAATLLPGTTVSDSSQVLHGPHVGRRPLAPAISPKKTIEGAIGGSLRHGVHGPGGLEDGSFSGYALVVLGILVVGLGICGDCPSRA
jgi:phosphatidate cytidylyltransferase